MQLSEWLLAAQLWGEKKTQFAASGARRGCIAPLWVREPPRCNPSWSLFPTGLYTYSSGHTYISPHQRPGREKPRAPLSRGRKVGNMLRFHLRPIDTAAAKGPKFPLSNRHWRILLLLRWEACLTHVPRRLHKLGRSRGFTCCELVQHTDKHNWMNVLDLRSKLLYIYAATKDRIVSMIGFDCHFSTALYFLSFF